MLNMFFSWFMSLSKKSKVFTVIIILLFLALSVQSARLAHSEYSRLKSIEKEYNEAKEAILESEEKEAEIINSNNRKTRKSINKNEDINKKLKEDEEIIDSDSISNSELYNFISKHEN